jgi:hypothetical protein
MELKAPSFWHYMLRHLFRVESQRLREQLWQAYPKSATLRYQVALCAEPAGSPHVIYERVRQLCAHLSPVLLMRTAERLCPAGKARPKDIAAFEEVVLGLMDKHGEFKWLSEEQTDGPKRAFTHRRA